MPRKADRPFFVGVGLTTEIVVIECWSGESAVAVGADCWTTRLMALPSNRNRPWPISPANGFNPVVQAIFCALSVPAVSILGECIFYRSDVFVGGVSQSTVDSTREIAGQADSPSPLFGNFLSRIELLVSKFVQLAKYPHGFSAEQIPRQEFGFEFL